MNIIGSSASLCACSIWVSVHEAQDLLDEHRGLLLLGVVAGFRDDLKPSAGMSRL